MATISSQNREFAIEQNEIRIKLPPFRVRINKMLSSVRRSLPPIFYVALACAVVVDLCRWLALPLGAARDWLNVAWKHLPPWTWTLCGLFIVTVLLGVAAAPIYLSIESFLVFMPAFGRSSVGKCLRRLARQEFRLSVEAIEQDAKVSRPYAVILAVGARLWDLCNIIRRLRNLERNETEELFHRTIANVREGWRDGVQGSIILDQLTILNRLPPPREVDRLLGQIVTANMTYLLGDLHEGRRLADRNMAESKQLDSEGLQVYQWLSSYAQANSRLFLGSFQRAANLLWLRWEAGYLYLSSSDKQSLIARLTSLATLNPIAAVGRHILLASACAGKSLLEPQKLPEPPIQQESREQLCERDWARAWYEHSLKLGSTEDITQHFTHGYMVLYRLFVEKPRKNDHEVKQLFSDVYALLNQIPDGAPPVSQYVKFGVRGLARMLEENYNQALSDLRHADTQSRMSGNRFFDGIFLPAYASVAAQCAQMPEARKIIRRARVHARLARSAFYDSQVDAAQAVLYSVIGRKGESQRLIARAAEVHHGLLPLYRM